MSYSLADTVKAFPWNRPDKTAGGICNKEGLKGHGQNQGGFGSLQLCLYPTLNTKGTKFSFLNPT